MTARLIPDLDDELTSALSQAEELLLEVAAWEDEDPETRWPAPLAGGEALAAVRRLYDALAPVQGKGAAEAGLTGELRAPDGKYEHVPLRVADVDDADIGRIAETARIFGTPDAPHHVTAALEAAAGATIYREPLISGDETRTRLVMTIAKLAGLLDLAPDDDTVLLSRVIAGQRADTIILTPDGEAAYKRFTRRANAMWALSDPLRMYEY
jgi:hypothetical protein